jgi:hypothetical protein
MQLLLNGASMHNNTAAYGGAVAVWGNASVAVVGGLLTNNSAVGGAAIDLNGNSSTTLQHVTLINNNAQENAGGLYAGDSAQVRCFNTCMLHTNPWDAANSRFQLHV